MILQHIAHSLIQHVLSSTQKVLKIPERFLIYDHFINLQNFRFVFYSHCKEFSLREVE